VRALDVARRMGLRGIVPYGDVLPEALIGQDRATLAELVAATLAPLEAQRSGGPQYVETAATWLQEGLSVAATARVLDVNERTVRYRLARIAKLTSLDLQHADDRFRLELAIRGARLLGDVAGG
jgi:DNA-binding PucR family transcriptional regulator